MEQLSIKLSTWIVLKCLCKVDVFLYALRKWDGKSIRYANWYTEIIRLSIKYLNKHSEGWDYVAFGKVQTFYLLLVGTVKNQEI